VKIAMVVSEFNFDVTSAMEERARRHAAFLGVEVSHVVHVPGVFDMGLAVKKLLRRKDVDAVVIIGTVIKGDTGHDELVANAGAIIFTIPKPDVHTGASRCIRWKSG